MWPAGGRSLPSIGASEDLRAARREGAALCGHPKAWPVPATIAEVRPHLSTTTDNNNNNNNRPAAALQALANVEDKYLNLMNDFHYRALARGSCVVMAQLRAKEAPPSHDKGHCLLVSALRGYSSAKRKSGWKLQARSSCKIVHQLAGPKTSWPASQPIKIHSKCPVRKRVEHRERARQLVCVRPVINWRSSKAAAWRL